MVSTTTIAGLRGRWVIPLYNSPSRAKIFRVNLAFNISFLDLDVAILLLSFLSNFFLLTTVNDYNARGICGE